MNGDNKYQMLAQLDHCGYPSKYCASKRAVKSNGELHRFCDHHRAIANRNQQRLQQRRRLQKSAMLAHAHQAGLLGADPAMLVQHQRQSQLQHAQLCSEYSAQLQQVYNQHDAQQRHLLADVSEEDLRVLEALLVGGDNSDSVDPKDIPDVDGDFLLDDCLLELFAMDTTV